MTPKTPTPSQENKAMAEMFQRIAQHGGGPAYPMQMELGNTDDGQPYTWFTVGLTKREKLAAMMMAGMYANSSSAWMLACGKQAEELSESTTEETYARIAVVAADALLERLKK